MKTRRSIICAMTEKIWNQFKDELRGFITSRVNDKEEAKDILDIPVMLTPSPDIDPFVIGYGQRA